MPIGPKEFWDSTYYIHPNLTDEMVRIAESTLDVKLPEEYIDLLRVQNGGYTKGFGYPMTQRTSWSDNHVPLSELAGIVTDPNIETVQNILMSGYMTEEWGLPPRQVLLCGDGHWWITLDYRKGDIPTISWIDTECGEDILVAPNFTGFIEGLKPEEEFEQDL
jgi:hypothetical protein